MNILDDIKRSFAKGSYLTQLIYINLGVFVALHLVGLVLFFLGYKGFFSVFDFFALWAGTSEFLSHIWGIVTYMFLHESFWHLLFNLMWLFWFGQLFLKFIDQKHLLSVYLLGGLSGGLLYFISYNLIPVLSENNEFARVLGASASVMAIVIAVTLFAPEYELYLMFLGKVKLKYIAVASIVLDIISIPWGNAGGHIAHLGGAFFGWWFVSQYKKGHLITKGFERFLDGLLTIFKPKPKLKVSYKKTGNMEYDYKNKKAAEQDQINRVLEKISKSGYSSLSKEEKELLFKMGENKPN
ncbi:MAG: rhomboid family intramembrane serine protease [Bacteroidales bacterium]|nr:rhomboid family intramembrane serine protease [Bacteroidales bacterium]